MDINDTTGVTTGVTIDTTEAEATVTVDRVKSASCSGICVCF